MTDEEQESRKVRIKGDAEEVEAILGVVSKEIPALIRSIIGSVFSEEAGREMGKAAGAFYKELKESGIPDEMAMTMTQNYISVFTSLGDVMKTLGTRGDKASKGHADIEEEIQRRIKEKLDKT